MSRVTVVKESLLDTTNENTCSKKNGKCSSNGKSNGKSNEKILYLSSIGYLQNILKIEIDSLIDLQHDVVIEIDKVIQKIGGLTNERE